MVRFLCHIAVFISLRNLFPVDRILQKQKAARQAADDAAKEKAKQTMLVSQSPSLPPRPVVPPEIAIVPPPPLPLNKPLPSTQEKFAPPPVVPSAPNPSKPDDTSSELTFVERTPSPPAISAPIPNSTNRNSFMNFIARRPGIRTPVPESSPTPRIENGPPGELPDSSSRLLSPNPPLLQPPRPTASRPATPGPNVTPMANISTFITRIVK